MSQISPAVRILALAGALVAVAGALAMFTLGRGSSEPILVATPAPRAARNAEEPQAAAPKTPAARPAKPVKVVAKPIARPAPALTKNPPLEPSGLPAAVDVALRTHEVVVVSLYVPNARVDQLATDEARAGAALARAGFVALNVLDEKTAKPLLAKLGTLEDPSLLVVKRPGEIALQLRGFIDRDTVAQAAATASS